MSIDERALSTLAKRLSNARLVGCPSAKMSQLLMDSSALYYAYMALKEILEDNLEKRVCPNCGSDLEMDSSEDFDNDEGWCEECLQERFDHEENMRQLNRDFIRGQMGPKRGGRW